MYIGILKNIQPRRYQQEIFENCKEKNCLVVLPTGVGKTLIALMLSVYTKNKNPSSKILFLAPTRPLAQQHLEYFKKNLQENFAKLNLFTGKINPEKRKKLFEESDIIFSTPQCISNDIKSGLYDLKEVSLLIEDECHRCLKNYAYTYIAKEYKEKAKNAKILGLTASPGTSKEIIKQIANNLGIETIEIRTRESEDVKEYLQELKFEIIKLDFPKELSEIKELLKDIYDKKIEELKNRKLLFQLPTKKNLLELQKKIINLISTGNRNFNVLAAASACAQAIKLQYCIELLETQTLYALQKYIQELFHQANKNKSRAVKQLVKQPKFNQAYIKITELISKNFENPKIEKIKEIVKREIEENKNKRILVFSNYRDSIIKICKTLNEIENINARVFVGQAKKGETGLTQKEQQEIIKDFSEGKINILVSSSIGEEGLDIPEVGAVIFYEPIPSAIRKIQRAGRTARLSKGKLIILMNKKTIDESYYWAAFHKEKRMYKALNALKEELQKKDSLSNADFKQNPKEKQKTLF